MPKLIITLLLIIFLASCASVNAESISGSAIVLDGRLKAGELVSVRFVPAALSRKSRHAKGLWWGAEFEPPRTLVEDLEVTLNGEKQSIPLSAYSDLGNLTDINLVVSDSGFHVQFAGGDAASSYQGVLEFNNQGYLVKRHIFAAEFPDESWEETKYSYKKD